MIQAMPTDFEEFVAMLRERSPVPKATGMHDVNGRELFTGDLIEFWFSPEAGFSTREVAGAIRMVDVVEQCDNGSFAAMNFDTLGGAHLWKFDGCCLSVGNVHGDCRALKENLLRFKMPGLHGFLGRP